MSYMAVLTQSAPFGGECWDLSTKPLIQFPSGAFRACFRRERRWIQCS